MKIEEWEDILADCKRSTSWKTMTSQVEKELSVNKNKDKSEILITNKDKQRALKVEFEPALDKITEDKDWLTIFEAGMMWKILVEGVIPQDYAEYHNCIAGKRFIKAIKSYEVV